MEHEEIGGSELSIWEKFRLKLTKYYTLYKVDNWCLDFATEETKPSTETHTDYTYLRATIYLGEDLGESAIDHVANHEIAHVFFGEVDDFVDKVCSRLDPTSESIFLTQWAGISERTAEKLSRLVERLNDGE
mgnify:CR=1 FL=1